MIIYRNKITIPSSESNYDLFLQERGIFEIFKDQRSKIKDYEELNITAISLNEFLDSTKYFCYQIPSNKIDYLFYNFSQSLEDIFTLKNLLRGTISLPEYLVKNPVIFYKCSLKKVLEGEERIEDYLYNKKTASSHSLYPYDGYLMMDLYYPTDYTFFLVEQLIKKLNYRNDIIELDFREKSYLGKDVIRLSFKALSREVVLLASCFNYNIYSNLFSFDPSSKKYAELLLIIKKIIEQNNLEKTLLSHLKKLNCSNYSDYLPLSALVSVLRLYSTTSFPFLGYEEGLSKNPLLKLEERESKSFGYFHTRVILSDSEKEYIGFRIKKNTYGHYLVLKRILKEIFPYHNTAEIMLQIEQNLNETIAVYLNESEILLF